MKCVCGAEYCGQPFDSKPHLKLHTKYAVSRHHVGCKTLCVMESVMIVTQLRDKSIYIIKNKSFLTFGKLIV